MLETILQWITLLRHVNLYSVNLQQQLKTLYFKMLNNTVLQNTLGHTNAVIVHT